ncbi:hypothetical protein AZF37_07570 [endosymbiont 'TC1' of Trimyema compressum]|uniref:hypothetical protein n=1 Tax=endosymbiont 'TC1' of Trimyema compressum TaxID=243899 RepID=UPI0007F0E354|nr:hypothetical protein [endosymbiont 'TC1' of Trimyema compressum]AMP21039.1 hypothetical protein AZF37_07570 [endosymbiont 'TC1' of Trimyema compressum]
MLFGSFFAVLGSFITGNGWLGVVFAAVIGAFVGLVYGGAVVSIRANQAVTGTGINILAVGLTALMSRMI